MHIFSIKNAKHRQAKEGVPNLITSVNILVYHFPGSAIIKNPPVNTGHTRDTGPIPGSGRSPGRGNGDPPQYSCLENSMDIGAWQTTVHGVAKSWT